VDAGVSGPVVLFHPWFGWFSIVTAILLCLVALATEKVTTKTLSEANNVAMARAVLLGKNLRTPKSSNQWAC